MKLLKYLITVIFLSSFLSTGYSQAPYDGATLNQLFFNVSIGNFSAGGTGDFTGPVGVVGSTGFTVNNVQVGDILIDDLYNRYKIVAISIIVSGTTATLDLDCMNATCVAPQLGKGNITRPTPKMGLALLSEFGSNFITANQFTRAINHSFLVIDSLYNASVSSDTTTGAVNPLTGIGYTHYHGATVDTIDTRASNLNLSNNIQITGETAESGDVQSGLEYIITYLNSIQPHRFDAGANVRVFGYGTITATKSAGLVSINLAKGAEMFSGQFIGASGDLSSGEIELRITYPSDYNYNNSDTDSYYPVITIGNRTVVLPSDPYQQRPDDTDDSINIFWDRWTTENRVSARITGLSGDFSIHFQM